MASDILPPSDSKGKKREKIELKPGFHLTDWVRLTNTAQNLSGLTDAPQKISLQELSKHNTQFDSWTAYNGRVYNISQYMHYHPGGVPKIMLGAGKDCTALFNKYHAWVNIESMLHKCFVGYLYTESSTIEENDEEDEKNDGNVGSPANSIIITNDILSQALNNLEIEHEDDK